MMMLRTISVLLFLLFVSTDEHGKQLTLKGIFTDFNNIFLWHESENINKKSLFPKFQLIPILRFQVMHDYVCSLLP